MASTPQQLAALGNDLQFRARVQSLLTTQAGVVYPESFAISAISQANPGVIIVAPHQLTIGRTVTVNINGSNCTPSLDGPQSVYVVDATHLKTNVNVTGAGTAGTITVPARVAFAQQVLNNPGGMAQNVAAVLVNRSNIIAANVTWDWSGAHPVTDAVDGAIASQIATDWSMLAGV